MKFERLVTRAKWLGVPLLILLVVAAALPLFQRTEPISPGARVLSQAKQVGLACKLWAGDHNGNYPKDLAQLGPNELPNKELLHYPSLDDSRVILEFVYHGSGKTDATDGKEILLTTDSRFSKSKRIVMYFDQSARVEPLPNSPRSS